MIYVISKAGPDSTTIDGSQPQDSTYGSVVTFLSGEDSTAILSGFTITSGTGWHIEMGDFKARAGGGIIYDIGSSPIIEKNIIRDNTADGGGGIDIASGGSNPIVRYNIIWRNTASEYDPVWIFAGGGIEVAYNARPMIYNNTIVDNKCGDGAGGVGAILDGRPLLYNNIIVNNVGGGISAVGGQAKSFYDDVWNNMPSENGNIYGNVTSIKGISVDPLFVDQENGDFRMQPGSPCIDAGDPNSPLDPDGTRADMRAKFYYHLDAPYVWKTGEKIDDSNGNNNGRPDAGETAEISITLINTSLDATGVSAKLVSNDPGVEVLQGTATFGNISRNQSANNENNPFKISVKPEMVYHLTTFYINITAGGNYTNTDSIEVMVGTPQLLVVDDDNQADYESYFIQPLNAKKIYPEYWEISAKGAPAKELMQQYKAVIWFTGDDEEMALSAEEQTAIGDYLDNGGRLFITGQNLGEALMKNGSASDSAFYANYLHAKLVADSTKPTMILGVTNDPITHGLFLNFSNAYGGAGNQKKPDIIDAISGAKIILKYTPGMGGAALCHEDPVTNSRMVYLAFGFEGIGGPYADSADKLMTNVLTWLQGTTAVHGLPDPELPKEFALEQNYPNPFNAQTMIEYQLPAAAHVTLEISNVLGQKISTLVDEYREAGRFHEIWDGKDSNGKSVPSGVYFYHLKAEGYSVSKKMLLVR